MNEKKNKGASLTLHPFNGPNLHCGRRLVQRDSVPSRWQTDIYFSNVTCIASNSGLNATKLVERRVLGWILEVRRPD